MFGFPNPVNEVAARVVACGVLAMSMTTLLLSVTVTPTSLWATTVIAYGFLARAVSGPTLSPLGRFATSVVAPRLARPRPVPGPPKRFAQAIGAVITLSAVGFVAAGFDGVAQGLLGLMILAAGLEGFLAFCIGCKVYGLLMRAGVVPEDACRACADIALYV
jgi:Domain of unknown function (DUF4395)